MPLWCRKTSAPDHSSPNRHSPKAVAAQQKRPTSISIAADPRISSPPARENSKPTFAEISVPIDMRDCRWLHAISKVVPKQVSKAGKPGKGVSLFVAHSCDPDHGRANPL